jgi:glycerol uptake facilitator protein
VDLSFGDIFLSEFMGTALLTLLGCGVVANAVLAKNKGFNGGFLMINFGWGFAVFAGVYVAYKSGAHLNPAVTVGILASGGDLGGADKVLAYFLGEFIGAFVGAVLCWLAYKDHFDDPESEAGAKLGTFVLVFVVLSFGKTPAGLGPLAVALLVVGIGASLGGPTGYAINPARDLSPRIAHQILPIKDKGDSDWAYSWVPIVGPLIGGVLGGLVANWVGMV